MNEEYFCYEKPKNRVQKILNEWKIAFDKEEYNSLDYDDDTELCYYRNGKWAVWLAVYDGGLEWTLDEFNIDEDGSDIDWENVCCSIFDVSDKETLNIDDLEIYSKEAFEYFKTIWNMGD